MVIEHLLADRPGEWRVSIVGSHVNDRWEMKIVGPNAFERSYTLEGSAGEHRPETIRAILGRMLPARKDTEYPYNLGVNPRTTVSRPFDTARVIVR